jgi:hypothetical protein
MNDKTPVLDELTERIRQIHALLEDPQPGLITWNLMLGTKVNELVDWWTESDAKT